MSPNIQIRNSYPH